MLHVLLTTQYPQVSLTNGIFVPYLIFSETLIGFGILSNGCQKNKKTVLFEEVVSCKN